MGSAFQNPLQWLRMLYSSSVERESRSIIVYSTIQSVSLFSDISLPFMIVYHIADTFLHRYVSFNINFCLLRNFIVLLFKVNMLFGGVFIHLGKLSISNYPTFHAQYSAVLNWGGWNKKGVGIFLNRVGHDIEIHGENSD